MKKTKKYVVYGTLPVDVFVEVEARAKEEALEKASGFDTPSLCHYCNKRQPGCWVMNDGLNGEVIMGEADED